MAAPILPIAGISLPAPVVRASAASAAPGAFGEVLSSAIRSVETIGQNASASVERFLAGEGEELHSTILATQRAELSFDLFLQVRNKVVSAYQEIMRMQV
jgi:flagellar hook-basal body complex protein FliE